MVELVYPLSNLRVQGMGFFLLLQEMGLLLMLQRMGMGMGVFLLLLQGMGVLMWLIQEMGVLLLVQGMRVQLVAREFLEDL